MPAYDYACRGCDERREVRCGMDERPAVECLECGARMIRVIAGGQG